ncbi:MAG: hypothetical protein ACI4PM_07595 [Butyricicoccus sp.]
MNIQAILVIVLVFAVILVLPVILTLRGGEDEGENPKEQEARLRDSEEYARCKDSEEVRQMAELVDSVPYVTRATLRPDGFRLERCIDRIGELERIEGKEMLFDEPISMQRIELVRLALEERLSPRYLSAPIYTGKKKERKLEGYYLYLDPQITGAVVDKRTKEAIYNGERTSDL